MDYLLKGIIIGLAIAAPVGPIGLLCIRRTLAYGRLSGLLSGLGAASADGFYGIIAGFGITTISSLLLQEKALLSVAGGIFLCYLGFKTFIAKPTEHGVKIAHKGLVRDYLSTLFLTITNPSTVFSFLAIFAGVGIEVGNYSSSIFLVSGVFMGSALWWITLSTAISFIRTRMTLQMMTGINKVSGIIISLFGIGALISLIA